MFFSIISLDRGTTDQWSNTYSESGHRREYSAGELDPLLILVHDISWFKYKIKIPLLTPRLRSHDVSRTERLYTYSMDVVLLHLCMQLLFLYHNYIQRYILLYTSIVLLKVVVDPTLDEDISRTIARIDILQSAKMIYRSRSIIIFILLFWWEHSIPKKKTEQKNRTPRGIFLPPGVRRYSRD